MDPIEAEKRLHCGLSAVNQARQTDASLLTRLFKAREHTTPKLVIFFPLAETVLYLKTNKAKTGRANPTVCVAFP